MIKFDHARRRRLAAFGGALVALGVALLASLAIAARPDAAEVETKAAASSSKCAGADKPAADSSTRELRKAVRCLINQKRSHRGATKLVRHAALRKAAQRHAKTMVAAGCLEHQCEGEDDLETRIRRAGYLDGAKAWQYAENTGCGLSAKAMVANWLASREHRLNLIEKRFRDLGVGVVAAPVKGECDGRFGTFAVVLGWRDAGS